MAFSIKYDKQIRDNFLTVDGNKKIIQQSMKELIEKAEMHRCPLCGRENVTNQIDFGEYATDSEVYMVNVYVIHVCMDCKKAWRIMVKINRNDVVKTIMIVKSTILKSEIETLFFAFVGIALAEAKTKLNDFIKRGKKQLDVKAIEI